LASIDKASGRAQTRAVQKRVGQPRALHHVENNLAAIRLWLTMLAESSCAKCRRVQAEGVSAIDRNLLEAQDSLAIQRLSRNSRRHKARKTRR